MKVTTDGCFFGGWVAQEIRNEKNKIENALDIGTGTGLLSLMVAQKNKVDIDAVEIDSEASQQAKENINVSPWKNQISIYNEDIVLFQPGKTYDCIISNPPFYENELASPKQKKNIAHHSEQLTISQVVSVIKTHLHEKGIFFLMLPYKRSEEIEKLLRNNDLYVAHSLSLSQFVDHSPFRIIIKGSKEKISSTTSTSIAIWNEHQQYSQDFITLLKDYYLYL